MYWRNALYKAGYAEALTRASHQLLSKLEELEADGQFFWGGGVFRNSQSGNQDRQATAQVFLNHRAAMGLLPKPIRPSRNSPSASLEGRSLKVPKLEKAFSKEALKKKNINSDKTNNLLPSTCFAEKRSGIRIANPDIAKKGRAPVRILIFRKTRAVVCLCVGMRRWSKSQRRSSKKVTTLMKSQTRYKKLPPTSLKIVKFASWSE